MTTPPDPAQGQPNPGPYGPPPGSYGTGYGGVQYPYPGDQAQQPYGQQPQAGGYPYNPYGYTGNQYPAGLDDKASAAAARPGVMVAGLILMILAALPFLAFGVLFLLVPLDASMIPPEVLNNPQLDAAGLTPESLITVLRTAGGVVFVLSLVYIVFAAIAFTGRNWSRILVTVMTAGFSAVLLLGLVSGGAADVASVVIILTPVVLSVAGVVTFFLAPSSRYFAATSR